MEKKKFEIKKAKLFSDVLQYTDENKACSEKLNERQ